MIQFRDPRTGSVVTFPGAKGKDGKSAYEYAKDGGYTGTEEDFYILMASIENKADKSDIEALIAAIENTAY